MKIFAEQDLRDVLGPILQQMKAEVHSADRNYLLNTNETQYVEYLVSQYRIEPFSINFDGMFISTREEMVAAERFPNAFDYNVERGRRYPKQIITYHLPFSGNPVLVRCRPSARILWTTEVRLEQGVVCFDVVNWRDDVDGIKRDAEETLRKIRQQAGNVTSEVAGYNNRLEEDSAKVIKARKAELLKQANLLEALGVPIKKADDVPTTFAVPAPKKKVLVAKPPAPTSAFVPEPTLDDATYNEILKIINDTGIEIERHPSIYQGKDEETLRDHFLMVLSPHFSSVTGETFNKTGKTDILIRHEGKNVFVAECGIWKGAKQFLGKIDQLLSYLTWRDSKTALISFVRNKEFGPVIETIKKEIPCHACFVKERPPVSEGWLRYEFTLKDDPSRSVRVAVLCFHYP